MTVMQFSLGEVRHASRGNQLHNMHEVPLSRMIVGMVYNNTGITRPISDPRTQKQALMMQRPIYNNPHLEVNLIKHHCDGWLYTSCKDEPVTLVKCSEKHVYEAYLADVSRCTSEECETELKLLMMLPYTMCIDPRNPITVNHRTESLRMYIVDKGGYDLDLVEMNIALPNDGGVKLSDDTRELLQPSQTWSVFEYSLDNTYLVDTVIKLKRQDVTMREFPWNTNNIPQRLVSVHGADVARRPRKTISLGRDSACPHHVPR